MIALTPAETPADIQAARQLIEEYAVWLDVDLCFQGFAREVATLPGSYAPPRGALLLALVDGQWAGCVAMRPSDEGICEMKRLFVRPAFRRRGVAQALVTQIILEAKRAGYQSMVLDTLDWMTPALALYERFGFQRCDAYYDNPLAGVVYLRLELAAAGNAAGAR